MRVRNHFPPKKWFLTPFPGSTFGCGSAALRYALQGAFFRGRLGVASACFIRF
jgi:hypothetical protein